MEFDRTARRLLIVLFSCFFILALLPRFEVSAQQLEPNFSRQRRAEPVTGGDAATATPATGGGTAAGGGTGNSGNGAPAAGGTTSTPTPTSNANTATTPNTSPTAVTPTFQPPASTTTTSSSSSSTSSSSTPTATKPATTQPVVVATSSVLTTNAAGETVTDIKTVTGELPVQTPSQTAAASQSSGNSGNESKGLGTGSIVGLAVAGGIALIGIISFFVWKFTRKRFTSFDDNEAIKWPELNSHGGSGHALPVNNTGRAGFDTGSEVSLSRPPSTIGAGFENHGTGSDPYAVPPLPHLNPNQPYRDDPAAYYDPYSGPVPSTFEPEGEAIPMTQIPPNGRSRSPGPGLAYDTTGRRSPGPNIAYDAGPVPGAGRKSPGPQLAYGEPGVPEFSAPHGMTEGPRARSPGPNAALGGRRSLGPQAIYDTSYGGAR